MREPGCWEAREGPVVRCARPRSGLRPLTASVKVQLMRQMEEGFSYTQAWAGSLEGP